MFRNVARVGAPMMLAVSVSVVALAGGCENDVKIAETYDGAAMPAFVAPDAGSAVTEEKGLAQYCPSSECPTGRTTCATSAFRCDVDLRTDRLNCGACGNACPAETFGNEVYDCIEGRCTMICSKFNLDCDGILDNGCEVVKRLDNEHCGKCGNKCTDPAKPCMARDTDDDIGCGCKGNDILCDRGCVDPLNDDNNCGGCGNACDRTGGGAPAFPHMYYGCTEGRCGNLKCDFYYGNCDAQQANGCEVDLLTTDDCGHCGNGCDPGQKCRFDTKMYGPPQCFCAPGKTFCNEQCDGRGVCRGTCVDLTNDRENCGACGIRCLGSVGTNGLGVCTYGLCNVLCPAGTADCNGDPIDYCETNTNNDPSNCGGCGLKCDAALGQACVGGECVVKPCDQQDAGEVAR